MLLFPNCKINLGLTVLNKREDGFHNLETVFFPLQLKDALEIIPTNDPGKEVQFTTTGFEINGSPEDNLCIKAYRLLKNDFPKLTAVKIHLHKAIPMGAGLGGGSSNAVFTLQLLNEKYNLGLSQDQFMKYALQLGSDCPFFVINKPCIATGRGEILEEIQINLSAYQLVLVNPDIHIHTARAFSQINLQASRRNKKTLKEIINQPDATWKEELKNDFEGPAFEQYPVIREIKENLYSQGASYASMSGSGSSVYGLFNKTIHIDNHFQGNYSVRMIQL